MLIDADPERKNFYMLDIGCGDFHWGNHLAKVLNAKLGTTRDITVHIINVRGESHAGGDLPEIAGVCKIYRWGSFKIEELSEEFKKHGLHLENQVDLMVSRWCIRHLADPLGTFSQAYDLLRPGSGTFLFDGFFFEVGDVPKDRLCISIEINFLRMLVETKSPFLMNPNMESRAMFHFLLRRTSETPCHLAMQYEGSSGRNVRMWQIGSEHMTKFSRETPFPEINAKVNFEFFQDYQRLFNIDDVANSLFFGDRALYQWMRSADVVDLKNKYGALDAAKGWNLTPLSQEEALSPSPQDLGAYGHTELHLAVLKNDVEGVRGLLNRGADPNEVNRFRRTPLHEAVLVDRSGELISLLLEHKADPAHPGFVLDDKSDLQGERIYRHLYTETPLDLAVAAKNEVGATLLQAKIATPSVCISS